MTADLHSADLELAVAIAKEAGALALERFRNLKAADVRFKGARDLVTEADLLVEQFVTTRLREARPDHRVLAEEEWSDAREQAVSAAVAKDPTLRPDQGAKDLSPLREVLGGATPVWVIDPIDGTTNFAHGHPFFAISIARVDQGRPVVGVVYAPALGELFCATRGGGAKVNGVPMAVGRNERVEDAIFATGFPYRRETMDDRDNNIAHMNRFLHEVRGFRRGGSAAIDLAFVAAGRFDFYFERQLEPWDVAGGALLVSEAGGEVSTYDGGDDWLLAREILASNGVIHQAVRARLGEVR